jgi:hypothetical protein
MTTPGGVTCGRRVALTGRNRWRAVGRTAVAAACLVWAYVAVAFHFLSVRLHY